MEWDRGYTQIESRQNLKKTLDRMARVIMGAILHTGSCHICTTSYDHDIYVSLPTLNIVIYL